MTTNKTALAQFYTPPHIGLRMSKLLQHNGELLEPAAGDGALLRAVKAVGNTSKVTAVEMDAEKAEGCVEYCDDLIVSDFFNIGLRVGHYDSIIMNPPYLKASKIPQQTKDLPEFKRYEAMLSGHANLYAYFILKSYLLLKDGGELIVILPSEFTMATGCAKLNTLLHKNGTFTNLIKFKKSPFLPEVSPDVTIFRYVKGRSSHLTEVEII